MKLSLTQKRIVGAATFWVLLYPFLFVAVWFAAFAGIMATAISRQEPPIALFALMFCFMPFHFLTIALSLGLMVFYWAHIIKNNAASDTWRILFGVTIFWFGYFVMPVYFVLFVWRDETPNWARAVPPPSPAPHEVDTLVAI